MSLAAGKLLQPDSTGGVNEMWHGSVSNEAMTPEVDRLVAHSILAGSSSPPRFMSRYRPSFVRPSLMALVEFDDVEPPEDFDDDEDDDGEDEMTVLNDYWCWK